ncbi:MULTISPECIES: PAS domain-containing protein [Sphingobium]|uniref:PAS domain-containing protein n=1 Tax=Sphingobium TaxID=165695 RepID=UPI001BE52A8B|nr:MULTISPECIES: PAS domain-containing protein [Sphingobium]MBT2245083.1 PAS domain-containing protein [Sphingobium sp. BHU LFT2]WBQ18924.1 PAS domain-containing protein [Sphingobium yanoikuyae]
MSEYAPFDVPAHLRAYFDKSTIALALASTDDDTPLILTNPGFEKLTGYASQEVIGRNCRLLQRDADNSEARATLRAFLENDAAPNVRTPIVNFKKSGSVFVNLLYMSRLRSPDGLTQFFFASQFDVSRAHPERLEEYDRALNETLATITPLVAETGMIIEGSLTTIANSAHMIAQAKMMLANLEG